jgi:isoquinoline 1-oxidoreductase alpha subunit
MAFSVIVNGKILEAEVDGDTPVLWVLRDVLGLTGTKFGCGIAMCGACTVHVAGEARRSCVSPISMVGSKEIRTIEALRETAVGRALQRAWRELEVAQCGYCQPGQLMSAAALLAANPAPSDADIDAVMSGNLCRCGTYGRIRAGIRRAASLLAAGKAPVTKGTSR